VRDWTNFSEALSEWRDNPVTETLRSAMRLVVSRRRQALAQAFLSGVQVPESDRKALLLVEQWVEDFFESSAEDVQMIMETKDDKHLGDHPAGV